MTGAPAGTSPDHLVHVTDLRSGPRSGLPTVGESQPRLAWRLEAGRPGVLQQAYQVEVAADAGLRQGLVRSPVITAGTVSGNPWPAAPLASRERRYWRALVQTDRGWTAWSDVALVQAGLLEAGDWSARPVSVGVKPREGAVAAFRREFAVPSAVGSAMLYITALGVHRTFLNGVAVSDELLEPGWQSYDHRLLHASYDVTGLVAAGGNVLASWVGEGWYSGRLGWLPRENHWGDRPALLAQLEVELADGQRLVVGTDGHWRGRWDPSLSASLYDGSTRDLTRSLGGWREPGFDDRSWQPASPGPLPAGLAQRAMPGTGEVAEVEPDLRRLAPGLLQVDALQNVTGYLRVRAEGPEGARVTIRHAEVLDGDGRLATRPLRSARATDSYVLDETPVTLCPEFTYHGFRYAEIEAGEGVDITSVTVAVVSSRLDRTGTFECSDAGINQLYSNVIWSQRGNFIAIPTDCPQRDERLGWTGDIMVFAPAACLNFDSQDFLASWLADLAADQRADGAVPSIVPQFLSGEARDYGATGWGDAAVLVPWTVYRAYGEPAVLAAQWPSMLRWIDYMASRRSPDGTWQGDPHFGDWLDPTAPPERPDNVPTSPDYLATSYLAYSARVAAKAARVLGHDGEAARLQQLGDDTARAAWARWSGHLRTTQTGCAVALALGIAPAPERPGIAAALAALVEDGTLRIGTGFLGTPLLLPALSGNGHVDTAYALLLSRACPGWLYPVTMGATTIWERWDSLLPDGSVNPGEMTSFNHYAYGAVADWLYQSVAGIAPAEEGPGYALIDFAPAPGRVLDHAAATIQTRQGKAAISWARKASLLSIRVTIPPGSTGRLHTPAGWQLTSLNGSQAASGPRLSLGSGEHHAQYASAPARHGADVREDDAECLT